MSSLIFRVLCLLSAATSTSAPAAPTAPAVPPPVVTPVAPPASRALQTAIPAKIALARQLVGHTQPPELMTHALLKGWDEAKQKDKESFAALDAIEAGLGTKLSDRGRAELTMLVTERIPQLHERLAALFAANCTEQELRELIGFYSSSAGRKLIHSVIMSDAGGDEFDDEKLTAEEAIKINRQASAAAAKTLNSVEQATLVKFAISPAGRAAKAVGPQVQAVSAEWMNGIMSEFSRRIEPIINETVDKAVRSSSRP